MDIAMQCDYNELLGARGCGYSFCETPAAFRVRYVENDEGEVRGLLRRGSGLPVCVCSACRRANDQASIDSR